MCGMIRAPAAESYTLITSLKGQLWKPSGLKHTLGVSGGLGSEKSMLNIRHLPEDNLVQRRRASMCQQINNVVEQVVSNEAVPFYPVMFPHGLDFHQGAYVYADTIPRWWYVLAEQRDPLVLQHSHLGLGAMLPVEAEIILLSYIATPAPYVQCSRAQYHVASTCWWQVVEDIRSQYLTPPRRLAWWGWHLTTDGPPQIFTPAQVFDPMWDTEVRRPEIFEEFEANTNELRELNLLQERQAMEELGEESEWVFWRAAQLALEAGLRDSRELGWPEPVGIRGGITGFRLMYDQSESDNETLSLNGNISEDSG